jgi:rhodanese-related sulfurtransferase
MNSNLQTTPGFQPQFMGAVSRQAVAILTAAVALGLVYNSASPLGVPVRKPPEKPVGATRSPNGTAGATHISTLATNAAGAPANPASADFIPVLTWMQVKPLHAAGKILLVDGRTPAAYQIEHIPGAISLSVKSPPAEFAAFTANHPKDTNIVVYCGSEMCELSHELAVKLVKELGYTNVQEMPGGITEYLIFEGKPNPPDSQ